MEDNVLLSMKNISMTFPGVKALQNVDFNLKAGEIHALMGENGAGKSTLIKVLNGVYIRDSGEIFLNGKAINNHSPQEAQQNGISTVFQEVNLCPNISVAENIFAGHEPLKHGILIDWKRMNERAQEILSWVGLEDIDVKRALGEYSVAIQQMVAIARAVHFNCKVLIFDEPTSSLDDKEVEKLFAVMRQLKADGKGILFVTHYLEQVYAICDRITVLRNGELEGQFTTAELPRLKLVQAMLGHEVAALDTLRNKNAIAEGKDVPEILRAVGLSHTGTIKPFDLVVRMGEVIGLTGLLGSGRSELVRTIFGADKADAGQLYLNRQPLVIKTPLDSIKHGMAYLPEDRKEESLIQDLSVRENMMIALQAKTGVFNLLPMAKQIELTDRYIKELNIKTPSPETPVKQLSGGNQQKVVLAKWVLAGPKVLILDDPTRGIDVGAKHEIYKLMFEMAKEGITIIMTSSETPEIIGLCDRIYTMYNRKFTCEIQRENFSQELVMKYITGVN